MGVVDDLQDRIELTKEKLSNLTNSLSEFASIKDSLKSTDGSIKVAAESLDSLIGNFNDINTSLKETVESLNDAAEILQKTDPAEIIKSQEELVANQQEIIKKLKSLDAKLDKKKGFIFG